MFQNNVLLSPAARTGHWTSGAGRGKHSLQRPARPIGRSVSAEKPCAVKPTFAPPPKSSSTSCASTACVTSSACRAKAISPCSTHSTTRDLAVTVCRQEGGAAMMAEAVGKATGRPGVCFVTRGPGATNASPGIHIARQDSTPMVVFVGQVARDMREREAFQELDYPRGVRLDDQMGDRDRRSGAHAGNRLARLPRGGQRPARPGGGRLPEDMLTERVAVADAPPYSAVETSPGAAEMEKFAQLLGAAESPILLLGGSRWSQEASRRGRAVRAKNIRCRSRRPSAGRISSMRCIPATPAISASVRIRNCSRASRRPISSCWSAAAWARCRRRATRCSTFRRRR